MKILVIGGGGREHALAWKLAQSHHTRQLWCAPGNPGMDEEPLASGGRIETLAIGADDVDAMVAFARERRPDLTVVGPDNPLALGVVDCLKAEGLSAFGPSRRAAQFETSKAWTQEFMRRHGVPTAQARAFTDAALAREFADSLDGRCAVKADGLALGKGVMLARSPAEASAAIDDLLTRRRFGGAGSTIVIQELLEGTEVSLHACCDGRRWKLFPLAQDHKRAFDGDLGPNTGGMGAVCPAPFLSGGELERMARLVLDPWLEGCLSEGIEYRGLIYPGVMLTPEGPKVLEFNARFGDPETQAYMPLLAEDLVELLEACASGRLDAKPLAWSDAASVCVVAASVNYPEPSPKGAVVGGLDRAALLPGVKVFQAGTARSGSEVVAAGGRVLGVTAIGATLADARQRAYDGIRAIHFEGMRYRTDIGAQALSA